MRAADGARGTDDAASPGGAVDTVNGVAPIGGDVSLTASDIPSTGPSDVQADLDALKYIESAADLDACYDAHGIVDEIIRTESLEADLVAILRRAGYEIDVAAVVSKAPRNRSKHRLWTTYYDEETAALVGERDRRRPRPGRLNRPGR